MVSGCPKSLKIFLCLPNEKKFPFHLPLPSFDITSQTTSLLNAHSGQMPTTGHFLVALCSLLNSFSPGSVGSIILAMSRMTGTANRSNPRV